MNSWWRGCVIYQIYPRSFQDTSDNGVGDLRGITKRLDYLTKLGVDAIWLSPVFASPMQDMGYDISNHTEIDPLFGNIDDFNTLVEQCHSLGLKIIIDQVLSHSSDQHPFFKKSRKDKQNEKSDWYVWSDPKPDGSPPNNWLSIFGGPAWEWEPLRKQYYLHNFLSCQPDFNFHNPEVQDWILSTVKFWLEKGVDGFRLDTVNYYFHDQKLRNNPPRDLKGSQLPVNIYYMQDHIYSINQPENIIFIERLRSLLEKYQNVTSLGEISTLELMAQFTEGNKKLHMAYSFELLGSIYSAKHFRENIEKFLKIKPTGWACWSFSNHDVIRHVSRWCRDSDSKRLLAKQAAAILLSLEGSVCLYQGEEVGQLESELEFSELTDPPGIRFWPENRGRDGCRTPMVWDRNLLYGGFSNKKPWLPIKDKQLHHDVASQDKDSSSVLSFYKKMLKFRVQERALKLGSTSFYDTPEPLLAFSRKFEKNNILCLFNMSSETLLVNLKNVESICNSPTQSFNFDTSELVLEDYGFTFLQSNGEEKMEVKKIT